MRNYKHCFKCGHQHENLSTTYCECCGNNMDKDFRLMEEVEPKEEKPKKGTFGKNFFRGKKTNIRRRCR